MSGDAPWWAKPAALILTAAVTAALSGGAVSQATGKSAEVDGLVAYLPLQAERAATTEIALAVLEHRVATLEDRCNAAP